LKAEAAGIWQPYGVELEWFDASNDCGSHPPEMAPVDWLLRLIDDPVEVPDAVLGAVQFRHGVPGDTIHILYRSLATLVREATIGNQPIGSLPSPIRDRLVGQAIGRVVAHELGHLLLALPAHDRSGLMRPTFFASDLIVQNHDQLRLSKPYAQRLHRRLFELASP
jgi:hypothetical protein